MPFGQLPSSLSVRLQLNSKKLKLSYGLKTAADKTAQLKCQLRSALAPPRPGLLRDLPCENMDRTWRPNTVAAWGRFWFNSWLRRRWSLSGHVKHGSNTTFSVSSQLSVWEYQRDRFARWRSSSSPVLYSFKVLIK